MVAPLYELLSPRPYKASTSSLLWYDYAVSSQYVWAGGGGFLTGTAFRMRYLEHLFLHAWHYCTSEAAARLWQMPSLQVDVILDAWPLMETKVSISFVMAHSWHVEKKSLKGQHSLNSQEFLIFRVTCTRLTTASCCQCHAHTHRPWRQGLATVWRVSSSYYLPSASDWHQHSWRVTLQLCWCQSLADVFIQATRRMSLALSIRVRNVRVKKKDRNNRVTTVELFRR